MKFSIVLPNCMHVAAITQPWEHELSGADIARVAAEADRLGFVRAFLPEHFLTPTPHVPLSGNHYFHSTTAQAFFAGATSRIQLSTMLTILPLHDPVILAKAIATLDWLSGGRAHVTFGVGWLREEFDIIGVPFEQRGRRADEYLEAMKVLWNEEKPSYQGKFVSFTDVAFGPKPIQRPHPPIWIGGDSDAALRRTARYANGWAPWLTKPEELPARLDFLRNCPGYDGRPIDVFFSPSSLNIGEEHVILDAVKPTERNAQQIVDTCATLADFGATETWVAPPPVTCLDEYLDHMAWVAHEVVPHCASR